MRILLTGGTGFLGSAIVNELLSKKNAICILTRAKIKKKNNISFIKGNIFNEKTYFNKIKKFKPDILIYCAWYNIPNFTKQNCSLNLKYSKKFIKNCLKIKSLSKFIFTGSCFEIANKKGRVNELAKTKCVDFFTKAKIDLLKFVKKKIINKKKYYWLRIFYAFGPKQRNNSIIPTIVKNLKTNKRFNINAPNNKLDFVYSKDVGIYIKKIIQKNPPKGIYNVGSGKPVKIKKIFEVLKKKLRPNYSHNPFLENKNKISFYSNNKKTKKFLKWTPESNIKKNIFKLLKYK